MRKGRDNGQRSVRQRTSQGPPIFRPPEAFRGPLSVGRPWVSGGTWTLGGPLVSLTPTATTAGPNRRRERFSRPDQQSAPRRRALDLDTANPATLRHPRTPGEHPPERGKPCSKQRPHKQPQSLSTLPLRD